MKIPQNILLYWDWDLVAIVMMEKIDDQANDKINQSLQICSTNKTKTTISINKKYN